jgi:uncharacterized protein YecE (DUF72 family)
MARLVIGISGWSYSNWRGSFYPLTLPSRRYLEFYAQHFSTTELNSSFYHLPPPQTYQQWIEQVPPHFIFAVKANRLLTHSRQVQNAEETWCRILPSTRALGSHLGPLLFQFPPSLQVDAQRLADLLQLVRSSAKDIRVVCEFRHASWFTEEVYRVLRRHGVALCQADSARYPRYDILTTDFLYYRLHGRPVLFTSSYSEAALAQEAQAITHHLQKGRDVYVYFNNTKHGHAVENARTLLALVQGESRPFSRAAGQR